MSAQQGPAAGIVFAGGMGLGAYHAGACRALMETDWVAPAWLAGSSIGAVTAALFAGNPPERRTAALRSFWLDRRFEPLAPAVSKGEARHLYNWASALSARLIGVEGHFRPRLPTNPFGPFRSLYDLSPMRRRLETLIDFERLNRGPIRVTVATTDVETARPVYFDTATERISIDHLLASCGLLPDFAPVEIGGRLLVDGGLSVNAPVDPLLQHPELWRMLFVLDLFPPDGRRPGSLEAAAARKSDLAFASQTLRILEAYEAFASQPDDPPERSIFYLSYRPAREEAGSERPYDLSVQSIETRLAAGYLDMQDALRLAAAGGRRELITMVRRDPLAA